MKSKLLTLLFAIGLFACSTGVMAGNTDKVLTKTEYEAGGADLASTVCDFVGGVVGAPEDCKAACKDGTNPDFAKLSCCMAALKNEDLVPESISSNIGKISYPLCSSLGCKIHPLLVDICGAVNCNTGYDDVKNCLAVSKKTCATDFSPNKCSASDKCAKVKCAKGKKCDGDTGKCVGDTPASGCKANADCTKDKKADTCTKGKCMCGTKAACTGTDTCVKGKCTAPASGCKANKDCTTAPLTWCTNGKCVKPPAGKCVTSKDCPSTKPTCTNGSCVASSKKCTPACTSPSVCDTTAGKCVCGPNKISCKSGDTCQTVSKGVKCCNKAKSNCYQ